MVVTGVSGTDFRHPFRPLTMEEEENMNLVYEMGNSSPCGFCGCSMRIRPPAPIHTGQSQGATSKADLNTPVFMNLFLC